MDSATLIALASFATAMFVGIAGWRSTTLVARKDEIGLLRDEVVRMHKRLTDDENRITQLEDERRALIDDILVLRQYAASLRALIVSSGIANVPEMPALRSDNWNRRRLSDHPGTEEVTP